MVGRRGGRLLLVVLVVGEGEGRVVQHVVQGRGHREWLLLLLLLRACWPSAGRCSCTGSAGGSGRSPSFFCCCFFSCFCFLTAGGWPGCCDWRRCFGLRPRFFGCGPSTTTFSSTGATTAAAAAAAAALAAALASASASATAFCSCLRARARAASFFPCARFASRAAAA